MCHSCHPSRCPLLPTPTLAPSPSPVVLARMSTATDRRLAWVLLTGTAADMWQRLCADHTLARLHTPLAHALLCPRRQGLLKSLEASSVG